MEVKKHVLIHDLGLNALKCKIKSKATCLITTIKPDSAQPDDTVSERNRKHLQVSHAAAAFKK